MSKVLTAMLTPPSAGDSPEAPPPPMKRARTSRPKVKTGCQVCKDRRIKCDEKRPACHNCIRSKRVCAGYPPPSHRPLEQVLIAPKPLPSADIVISTPLLAPISTYPRLAVASQTTGLTQRSQHKRFVRINEARKHIKDNRPQNPTPPVFELAVYKQPTTLSLDEQEGMYFELFREQTASELSGFFDNLFWSSGVLRECHSEPAILHAVVALGALYMTLETNHSPASTPPPPSRGPESSSVIELPLYTSSPSPSHSSSTSPASHSSRRHWEMAVRKYSHAIHQLTEPGARALTTHRTLLMASVLLACFDSFVGDHRQAIRQIQTGLTLLKDVRTERGQSTFVAQPAESVEVELLQMFTRLSLQAKSYELAFHFPDPYVIHLTGTTQTSPTSPSLATTTAMSSWGSPPPSSAGTSPLAAFSVPVPPVLSYYGDLLPMPDRFTTSIEARLALDALTERMHCFVEIMRAQVESTPMGLLPASMHQFGAGFAEQMRLWAAAYEHIFASRTGPGVSAQEKTAIVVLRLTHVITRILFLMTFRDSEMAFDEFGADFEFIVDLALEVIGDEERRAALRHCPNPRSCRHQHRPSGAAGAQHQHQHQHIFGGGSDGREYAAPHIKASFSADLGIVPPLFCVATKCRDPVVRRRAIQLLRSSARREGMWDSELAAHIGIWVAGVEEGDGHAYSYEHDGNRDSDLRRRTPTATSSPAASAGGFMPSPEFEPVSPGLSAWEYGGQGHARHQQRLSPAAVVPAERRVMIKAVDFDLRERQATIQLGTRGLPTGAPDLRTRVTRIVW